MIKPCLIFRVLAGQGEAPCLVVEIALVLRLALILFIALFCLKKRTLLLIFDMVHTGVYLRRCRKLLGSLSHLLTN